MTTDKTLRDQEYERSKVKQSTDISVPTLTISCALSIVKRTIGIRMTETKFCFEREWKFEQSSVSCITLRLLGYKFNFPCQFNQSFKLILFAF